MSRTNSIAEPSKVADPLAGSLSYLAIGEQISPQIQTPCTPHYEVLAPFSSNPAISFAPTSMKYRNLGKSGIKIPLIGLGAWSTFGTRFNEQAAEELVTLAYDNGINYFDTGDGFAQGKSETTLGNILERKKWNRNSYVVSTKLFWSQGPSASPTAPALSRKFIVEAVDACLKRLKLQYVDIVIINKLDGMCPMEEIVRAMAHILDKGQAFYWGTSRWSPVHIMEAFTVARQFNLTPPTIEQIEYHMFNRDKMELYMPELYHKLGVGVVSWSPHSMFNDDGIQYISRRALSIEDKSARATKQTELTPLAMRLGCDSSQLLIAWSLKNENINSVLISPRSPDHLHQLLNSLRILPKITQVVLDEVDKILNNKPTVKRLEPRVSICPITAEVAAATTDEQATTV